MAWLGLATLTTIYGCIFLSLVSGRLGWVLLCGWITPILALVINYKAGMEINGLMVLLCLGMLEVCRRSLADVCMWNVKLRGKTHSVLFGMIYVISLAFLLYSFAQAQIQGYMLNVQGWGNATISFWRMFFTIVPLMVLNWLYTGMIYTTIDRARCKTRNLILLNCNFFMANESGGEKGIQQGYFMEGVQNGITYYFRMTKRTFRMLRREKVLKLETRIGMFGGVYVMGVGKEDLQKRVRRSDRKTAKWGLICYALVLVASIWLFWFRV